MPLAGRAPPGISPGRPRFLSARDPHGCFPEFARLCQVLPIVRTGIVSLKPPPPLMDRSSILYLLWVCYLGNHFFVYRQSEAGNEKYCYELHARSGLRFIIRHQEDAWIVPTSTYLAFVTA